MTSQGLEPDTQEDPVAAAAASELYRELPEDAAIGAYVQGSPETRTAIVAGFGERKLPEALVTAILELRDAGPMMQLAQRRDLKPEVLDALIAQGSVLVQRAVCSNLSLTGEQMVALLPGDAVIRQRLFEHPNTPLALRREIVLGRDAQGRPLELTRSLRELLAAPPFATWASTSADLSVRKAALANLPRLSRSRQWDLAATVVSGAYPVHIAASAAGWDRVLHGLLHQALARASEAGEAAARVLLGQQLQALGRPPESALEEARLLADPAEAVVLVSGEVDWTAMENAARNQGVTTSAARVLLGREDCPGGFISAALVALSSTSALLEMCTAEQLAAAVTRAGFVSGERARLQRLLVTTPPAHMRLLDAWARLPFNGVLSEVVSLPAAVRQGRMQQLRAELLEQLGSGTQQWAALEARRAAQPGASVETVVGASQEG